MGTMIGLLVGIDEYIGDVQSLRGCRNDVERAREVLARRADSAGLTARFTTLVNGEATRAALIAAFRETFAEAGPSDTAVFYYAGHGSQQEAPPEHLVFEPDGLDETLVLHDSRTKDGYDLADVELGALVREVTARGTHMFVVLDCCHSGSGLRDADGAVTGIRRAPTARGRRPVESYLSFGDTRAPGPGDRLATEGYVLLAACRSDQTAKEVQVEDGRSRGALSVALEAALTGSMGPMSYLQLQRRVAAAVVGVVADQTPVLECRPSADADRAVLGGTAGPGGPLHVVTFGAAGWRLDAGSLHGLPEVSRDGRPVTVTLHPLDATDLSPDAAVAWAHVRSVLATSSLLAVDTGTDGLDPVTVYRAVIRDLPSAEVTVAVDAVVPQRDAVVAALGDAIGLTVVPAGAAADLLVTTADGELRLSRAGATRPLVAARPLPDAVEAANLATLRDEAVQVGRWLTLARRTNPTTRIAADELTLELRDTADRPIPPDADGSVRLVCPPDAWPKARIRVTNRSTRRLFVSVLALTELYGVVTLFDGEGEWLAPGTSVYVPAADGSPDLFFYLPTGESLTTDVLLALAATEEFTSTSLRQDDLAAPSLSTPTRAPGGARRGVGRTPPPRPPESSDDWTTTQIRVTTYLPAAGIQLSNRAATALSGTVTVLPHLSFTASARLAPSVEAARESMVPLLPSVLVDDPDSRPFSFLPVRAESQAVDVLELDDLVGAETVTAAHPLVLRVPQTLAPGEVVLPVMFDGEDYLPVGLGRSVNGATEIRISRLPTQGEITRRSVGGALKILFRKVVGRRLGAEYDWPHLSVVAYDTTGTPEYEHDPARVREAITGAQTALLLVHGIIGETRGMARAAGPAGTDLARGKDVVLALDYENLDTAIEVTGSDLARALERVGILAGAGPRLTIVAHSMGGLVARCFIERQGGARLTDRLITCGTPHLGSPWPRVEDALTALLGLALNLSLFAGGVGTAIGSVLAAIGRAAESIDTALDQMRPGSDLLTTLAGAPDPGVPYTLIRGTRPFPASADPSRAQRIVGKLTGAAIDVLFGGEENDIAVSVASAGGVGQTWPNRPRVLDVGCNHVTYFADETAVAAVKAALTS